MESIQQNTENLQLANSQQLPMRVSEGLNEELNSMLHLDDGVSVESGDIINWKGRPSAMRMLRKFSSGPEEAKLPSKVGKLMKKQPQFPG